ncbi:unnamed protein product [Ilex paraguariensis]|uniref:Ribosomal protein L2 n=1 Tax=Ilex paraguariensis TaxID=185542 RepID=A0ABC8RUP9_9AQUA
MTEGLFHLQPFKPPLAKGRRNKRHLNLLAGVRKKSILGLVGKNVKGGSASIPAGSASIMVGSAALRPIQQVFSYSSQFSGFSSRISSFPSRFINFEAGSLLFQFHQPGQHLLRDFQPSFLLILPQFNTRFIAFALVQ